jgi:hypothetical protein
VKDTEFSGAQCLEKFEMTAEIIRFDGCETRAERHEQDIKNKCDESVDTFSDIYNRFR